MDFVIEIISEILEEILSWLISSSKVPKAVRYAVVSIVMIALLTLFIALTVTTELLWGRIFGVAMVALIIVAWLHAINKIKNAC